MNNIFSIRQMALILVLVLALVGFGLALYELTSPASGTTGTAGATLVTVSTALLAIAATALAVLRLPQWLVSVLFALLLIDAGATAAAGYFLMANFLTAAMIAALVLGFVAAVNGHRQGKLSS